MDGDDRVVEVTERSTLAKRGSVVEDDLPRAAVPSAAADKYPAEEENDAAAGATSIGACRLSGEAFPQPLRASATGGLRGGVACGVRVRVGLTAEEGPACVAVEAGAAPPGAALVAAAASAAAGAGGAVPSPVHRDDSVADRNSPVSGGAFAILVSIICSTGILLSGIQC